MQIFHMQKRFYHVLKNQTLHRAIPGILSGRDGMPRNFLPPTPTPRPYIYKIEILKPITTQINSLLPDHTHNELMFLVSQIIFTGIAHIKHKADNNERNQAPF